jgi:hypothetical protein
MNDSTRRGFLTLMGTGAATVATVAVAPQALGKDQADKAPKPDLREPLVAHVRDPRRGEVALMVGESEVVVHDPDLVARLVQAAGR